MKMENDNELQKRTNMFFKVMSQYSKEKAEKNHEKSEKI
jgi:hypothetical protein